MKWMFYKYRVVQYLNDPKMWFIQRKFIVFSKWSFYCGYFENEFRARIAMVAIWYHKSDFKKGEIRWP